MLSTAIPRGYRDLKNLPLHIQKVMKHQDDGCSAHYSLVARKNSHKEFLKCAGTDTEYLVPRSDPSTGLILSDLQKRREYAF